MVFQLGEKKTLCYEYVTAAFLLGPGMALEVGQSVQNIQGPCGSQFLDLLSYGPGKVVAVQATTQSQVRLLLFRYMHSLRVLHIDLKAENILLTRSSTGTAPATNRPGQLTAKVKCTVSGWHDCTGAGAGAPLHASHSPGCHASPQSCPSRKVASPRCCVLH